MLELRLHRLAPATRSVLTAAAIWGRTADLGLLVAVTGEQEQTVVDALEEAERADLVRCTVVDGDVRYSFVHELIRLTLLAGVSAARRQRMHLAAAAAIENVLGGGLGRHAAELVHHLTRAGPTADPGRLRAHLLAAADHALATAAFEDALRHVDAALGLCAPGDGEVWAQLFVRRGRVLCGLGRWDEAESTWEKAVHLLIASDARAAAGQLSADAAANLFWVGRYEQCMAVARLGLGVVGERVCVERVRLLAFGGRCAALGGDHRTGEHLTGEALRVADLLGERDADAVALFARTVHHWAWVQPAEAARFARPAAEAARSSGALWDLADGLGFAGLAAVLAGELGELAAIGTELDVLVHRLGHYGAALLGGRSRLLLEITRGDLDAVHGVALADRVRCETLGLPWVADSFAWLGLVAFWRGDWAQADALLDRGQSCDPTGALSGACWAVAFLLHAYQGEHEICTRMLDSAAPGFPAVDRPAGLGGWTSLLAATEGLVVLGRSPEAASHYPLVEQAISAGNVLRGYDNRLVQGVAGLAAAAGDRWDLADEHFRRALRQADELPHRLEQPETRRLYAGALLARGDPAGRVRAAELLDEAIVGYRTIGMPRHREMAAALRATCDVHAPAGPSPGGLTGREREILALLAAGRASKEVARSLSISIATVARHTANVYAKIGASNRAEATRWALANGLHGSSHRRQSDDAAAGAKGARFDR